MLRKMFEVCCSIDVKELQKPKQKTIIEKILEDHYREDSGEVLKLGVKTLMEGEDKSLRGKGEERESLAKDHPWCKGTL